jgi:hypothetical protein
MTALRVVVGYRVRASVLGAAIAALLGTTAVAGAAELPTQGDGLVTDGHARVAFTALDDSAVSVVTPATGAVATTPLPTLAAGRTLGSVPLGFVGDRVLLVVRDITGASSGATGLPERFALVDAAGGGFRWICGRGADDPITGPVSLCPSAQSAGGYAAIAAGKHWIRLYAAGPHGRGWAVRWGLKADGSFFWRTPTKKEDEKVLGGQHLDLDRATPRPEEPFGVRIRTSEADSDRRRTTFAVRKVGDAKRALLQLAGGDTGVRGGTRRVWSVQVGSRGACIARDRQIVIFDRRTRKVWRRTAPMFTGSAGGGATCVGASIVTEVDGALDWSLRWPEPGDRNGWTASGTLRPGKTLKVPGS